MQSNASGQENRSPVGDVRREAARVGQHQLDFRVLLHARDTTRQLMAGGVEQESASLDKPLTAEPFTVQGGTGGSH